ncbi:cilia- and flagella-associated protein 184 [Drosophila takahashii]|uniref:cilia- and flagella-associated protein 184 n=1 Tax=Drosophila takahashii TaxID=29030 RepID=UPI0038993A0A
MPQDPESTKEVVQVAEAPKETTDQLEVNNAPESTVVPEEIPKLEEEIQPIAGEPVVQEESYQTALLEATEEAPETEITEHLSNESFGLDVEPTEPTDDLSPEEKKKKLKKERRERLKDLASNRFTLLEVHEPTVSFTAFSPEEIVDKGEEEEEKQEVLVNFDEPFDDELESESIQPSDDSEEDIFTKFRARKMVDLFPVYGFSNEADNRSIFDKDPKYDDSDDAMSMAAISMASVRTLKPADPDSVQLKTNFLRDFDVPSLSDISEEHELTDRLSGAKSTISVYRDQGHFVDPAASPSSSSSSVSESLGDLDNEQQDDGVAPDSQDDSSVMSDIPEFAELPDTAAPTQKSVTMDEFNALTKVGFVELEDKEDSSVAYARALNRVVHDLLRDLIEEAAYRSDYQNEESVLRAKFDKSKLLVELQRVIHTYMIEKYTNDMMSNRLVEYYKRNRNTRVFVVLTADNEKRYQARYFHALSLLDSLKERLDVAKHKHAVQMNRVMLDLHSAQSVASITEERLEHLFHKYLVRSDSDYLRRIVDRELRLMSAKRNEISDSRLFLITRKHTLAHIMDKIKELDTLSETVNVRDYISAQNEVLALQKKIEERNFDLKRLRTQFLMDVHLTRHNREKALALGEKFEVRKTLLKNAIDKQRVLRKRLYDVKLERTKMRQQSRELTFQGGILAMPSLMYDYDKTMERLKEKQESVAKLRETMKALQRRVDLVEGRSL